MSWGSVGGSVRQIPLRPLTEAGSIPVYSIPGPHRFRRVFNGADAGSSPARSIAGVGKPDAVAKAVEEGRGTLVGANPIVDTEPWRGSIKRLNLGG